MQESFRIWGRTRFSRVRMAGSLEEDEAVSPSLLQTCCFVGLMRGNPLPNAVWRWLGGGSRRVPAGLRGDGARRKSLTPDGGQAFCWSKVSFILGCRKVRKMRKKRKKGLQARFRTGLTVLNKRVSRPGQLLLAPTF